MLTWDGHALLYSKTEGGCLHRRDTRRGSSHMSLRYVIATGFLLSLIGLLALRDGAKTFDLDGRPVDPLATETAATVLVFVGTDCPISNRYAPEIQRLSTRYQRDGVQFFLVYVDPQLSSAAIRQHLLQFAYNLPALRDPEHAVVARSEALVTPQVAVFNADDHLVYSGRIDDRYLDFGQQRPAARTRDLEDALQAVLSGQQPAQARTRAIGCYIADLKE